MINRTTAVQNSWGISVRSFCSKRTFQIKKIWGHQVKTKESYNCWISPEKLPEKCMFRKTQLNFSAIFEPLVPFRCTIIKMSESFYDFLSILYANRLFVFNVNKHLTTPFIFLVPLLSKINGCKHKRIQHFSVKLPNLGFSTGGKPQTPFQILFKSGCRIKGIHILIKPMNYFLAFFINSAV